jgi:hypothetical protein
MARIVILLWACGLALAGEPRDEYVVRAWKKIVLHELFYSEGATVGDFNKDGKTDMVAGPWWFEGPDFQKKHEYMPEGKPFVKDNTYSKNFFAFTYDFNKDGWTDILIYGFPGEDASWYENPKGKEGHWTRNNVFKPVDNESPHFTQLVGDDAPEIVCCSGGHVGYVRIDDWKFRPVSPKGGYQRFTHGLGVGDVNGDGRLDILEATGWWEQPKDLTGDPLWTKHPAQLGKTPAQMYAYDVDGDSDNDVIATVAAHGYGISWFEHVREGEEIKFKPHVIVGTKPEDSKYGVLFTQMHAVDLVDMDGDGLKDIVTGKRHFAHGSKGDADPLAPPALYWFRLVRGKDGVDWVPYQIDGDSGVGTQVVAADVNGDEHPDVVVGSKRGAFILIQELRKVSKEEWEKAQPKPLGK